MVKFLTALCLVFMLIPALASAQDYAALQVVRKTDTLSSNGDSFILEANPQSGPHLGGFGSVSIQTLDSYTGTWEVQCSVDGTNFDADSELAMQKKDGSTLVYNVADTVGIWTVTNAAGCRKIKIIATAGFAATDTVMAVEATQTGGAGGSGGGGGGGTSDTTEATQLLVLAEAEDINASTAATSAAITGLLGTVGAFSAANTFVPQVTINPDTGEPVVFGNLWQIDIPVPPDADAPSLLLAGRTTATDQIVDDDSFVIATADHFGAQRVLCSIGGVDCTMTVAGKLDVTSTGSVANDAADGGNPVKIGGFASTTVPSAVTASDRVNGWYTLNGAAVVSATDPCQRYPKVHLAISQATSTELFTGTASNRTFICDVAIIQTSTSTQKWSLINGTGTVCATSTSALIGATTAANGTDLSVQKGNGGYWVLKTDTDADNVCLVQGSTDRINGSLTYVVAPNQ